MSSTSMITVNNLTFDYPNKRALDHISFTIPKGSITALVGPNGAGKTTLLRLIAGLYMPFSGSITVNGIRTEENPRAIHHCLGYLSDFFGVYEDLTVKQCLTYIALSHHLPSYKLRKTVTHTAELLGLNEYFNVKAGTLSRGLRQRLGIAQALIHKPAILLLDEPASGLDPEARYALSSLLRNLEQEGMTLIVSSHILSELEDYCTDMLVLREGQLVEHCSIEKASGSLSVLHITFIDAAAAYLPLLHTIPAFSTISAEGNSCYCHFHGTLRDQQAILKTLILNQVPVVSFAIQKERLQDVYMSLSCDKGTSQ